MAKDDLIIMTKQEFAQATTTMIWGYVEIVLKQNWQAQQSLFVRQL